MKRYAMGRIVAPAARRGRALALALLLAGAAVPALGDDGDGGGGGAGAGGGGGDGGSGGGSEAGGGVPGFDLGPNPGSNPLRDAGRLFRSVFGGGAPAAAVAAPPPLPPGRAPPAAAPPELVALGVPPAALPLLRAEGFVVLGERRTADGTLLLRLRAPPRLGALAALQRLRALAPGAAVDRNHLFRPATDLPGATPAAAAPGDPGRAAPGRACAAPPPGLAIALVDTAVEAAHPGLAPLAVETETLRGPGRRPSRPAHGTAVALRLAEALPGARLVALDAFHLGPEGETADAFDIAAALDRAATLRVAVANLSFAGPANAVVERLGAAAAGRGVVMVAAAGNEGPRAAPRYPAAYAWAVAATAVRADGGRWARAPVGPHIAFAAHGVEVALPGVAGGRPRRWSGTSFAAPLVSAALAVLPPAEDGPGPVPRLAARARDLGAPGRDPVFGWGQVAPPPPCAGASQVAGP